MKGKETQWFEDAERLARIRSAFQPLPMRPILPAAPAEAAKTAVDQLVKGGVIQTKPWWQSLGINGSAVTLIGAAVSIAAGIAGSQGIAIDVGAATEIVTGLVGLIGAAMTWWGRVRASQPISRTRVLPGLNIGGKP